MIQPSREKEHDVSRARRHLQWRESVAALAALLLLAAPAMAAAGAREEGERVESVVHPGGVELRPAMAYSRAVLTVSGGGQTFQLELEAGEALRLDTFTPDGEPLPDGHYRWELRLQPTPAVAERLRAATMAGRADTTWRPQNGGFFILDGRVVDPSLRELEPVAAPAAPAIAAPTARTEAFDVDGATGAERAASPEPAFAPVAAAALSSLPDSDALAPARSPGEETAAAAPIPEPRRDATRDAANGRTDPDGER